MKDIVIKPLFGENSIHTCLTGYEACPFYFSTNFGQRDKCMYLNKEIYRSDWKEEGDGLGLTIPHKNCPHYD